LRFHFISRNAVPSHPIPIAEKDVKALEREGDEVRFIASHRDLVRKSGFWARAAAVLV
jgi:hypothetical protein